MKVELKQIIEQLTELVGLEDGYKVAALVDTKTNVVEGWYVVKVLEDGRIIPIETLNFKTVKEMMECSQNDNHLISSYIKKNKDTKLCQ